MAFGGGGRQSARSSMSELSGCSHLPRAAPPAGAASRWWQGSLVLPARRSTADGEPLPGGKVRRKGGGRKRVAIKDPEFVPALKRLVEPVTRGDPVRPLTWVSKSMDKLATTLTALGHPVSADTVRAELPNSAFRVSTTARRRGLETSRPQCAIRIHQCQGESRSGRGTTRNLGRYKEERARRQLPATIGQRARRTASRCTISRTRSLVR